MKALINNFFQFTLTWVINKFMKMAAASATCRQY